MESLSREDCFYLAEVLIEQNCPNECLKYVLQGIQLSPVLSEREQNIFITPYRQIAAQLRSSIRNLKIGVAPSEEPQTESQGQALNILVLDLQNELVELCSAITEIIVEQLLPNAANDVDKALYHLVVADFQRFIAELDFDVSPEAMVVSQENYNLAHSLAEANLPITNPVYLTIQLNYAILLHDIVDQEAEAIDVIKDAYNTVRPKVSELSETDAIAVENILKLMSENLINWATTDDALA